jgi:RNA polymerase sigma-70 factor (ECF subfamily)
MANAEAELIQRARTDPDAFGQLYGRYVDRIYNYIYHRVGSVDDAEDLTARAFHRALVGLPDYVDRGAPFSAWLYRIAHNLVANWHRDQSRRAAVGLEEIEARADVGRVGDGLALKAYASQRVRQAVRDLDVDRQALLVLKFSEGLSNAEIGDVLGRSEGAVKSLYHRTLVELRDELASLDDGAALDADWERDNEPADKTRWGTGVPAS